MELIKNKDGIILKDFDSYKIYRNGDIESMPRPYKNQFGDSKKLSSAKLLKTFMSRNGYLYVDISRDGKTYRRSVHSLVTEAYIGKIPHKLEINHIDGDKENNNYSNLEYVTSSYNKKHAFAMGLRPVTAKQINARRITGLRNKGKRKYSKEISDSVIYDRTVNNMMHKDLVNKYGICAGIITRMTNEAY